MQEVVSPFKLKYDGMDTKNHIIEAQQYGQSIIGASKLYSSVAHYCVSGNVPKGNYRKEFACYATIPTPGSWDVILFVSSVATQYQLFPELIKHSLSFFVFKVVRMLKMMLTGEVERDKAVEMLIDALKENAEKDAEFKAQMLAGILGNCKSLENLHAQLIETLPELVNSTERHTKNLVAPIGKSCKILTSLHDTPHSFVIDEADADVIRSPKNLEVKDMAEFKCERIRELDLNTGHCQLVVEGIDGMVKGKISDPVIEKSSNIYSQSLDTQKPFYFMAKSIEKNGEIVKLHISDATDKSATE